MIRMRSLYLGAVAVAVLAACSPQPKKSDNPFAEASTLALQAPPFDKIKDSDYQPAFEEGMKQQLAEIDAIANSSEAATFDNTIIAIEKSGRMLDRVSSAFFAVVQANTDEALDKVQSEEAPKLAAHGDAIFLNPKLFARVKAVYDQRAQLKLDAESLRLLEIYYLQFIHAGANLSDADKDKLRALNKEDASLETVVELEVAGATRVGKESLVC